MEDMQFDADLRLFGEFHDETNDELSANFYRREVDLSRTIVNNIHFSIDHRQVLDVKNNKIILDLSEMADMNILKLLSKHKLPNLSLIILHKVPEKNKYVKQFLMHSFPNEVNVMTFNVKNPSLNSVSYYFKALLSISSRVKSTIYFNNYELTEKQFWKLVKANKTKSQKINFTNCRFLTSSIPDLTDALVGFTAKELDFWGSGKSYLNHWASHPQLFENIIIALGRVEDVRESLRKIVMIGCKMKTEDIREILDDNGFERVEIVG